MSKQSSVLLYLPRSISALTKIFSMKKLITSIVCLCIVAYSATAQISFGPKAGITYTSVSTNFKQGDKPDDWENPNGIGWHLGGYLNFQISDKLAFRPELVFNARRTASSGSSEMSLLGVTYKTEYENTTTMSFIEIPLLLAIGSSEEGIQLHVGPSINLLGAASVNSKVTTTIGSSSTTAEGKASGSEAKEGSNSFELGACAGLIYTTSSGLNFGVRYTRGLTPINSEGTDMYTMNYNLFALSVGYTIGR